MSVEFVDTNILVYAHDGGAGEKQRQAIDLIARLSEDDRGALSTQVLAEFYWAATRKLQMSSEEAEEVVQDFGVWTIHRPAHGDLLRAARVQRRYRIAWWDALVVTSAAELGCEVLWSEDLGDGQRLGGVVVRNPFS